VDRNATHAPSADHAGALGEPGADTEWETPWAISFRDPSDTTANVPGISDVDISTAVTAVPAPVAGPDDEERGQSSVPPTTSSGTQILASDQYRLTTQIIAASTPDGRSGS